VSLLVGSVLPENGEVHHHPDSVGFFRMSSESTRNAVLWRKRGFWFLRFATCVIVLIAVDWITARWQQSLGVLMGDPQLGWRMKPHGMVQLRHPEGPYLLKLNSMGIRDREYSIERTPRQRILSIGGSVSIGHGVPLEDTYCKALEQFLGGAEVINLGCFGYSIDQEHVLIQEQVPLLKPDLVIQCISEPSARWVMRGRAPDCDFSKCRLDYSPADNRLTILPPEFNRLQRLLGYTADIGPFKINFEATPDPNEQESPADIEIRMQAIEALLKQTRDYLHSKNSKYLVLYVPQQIPDHSDLLTVLRKMSANRDITLVDAASHLEHSEKNFDGPKVFVSEDDRHLTEYGHYLIAQLLHHHLAQETVDVASE